MSPEIQDSDILLSINNKNHYGITLWNNVGKNLGSGYGTHPTSDHGASADNSAEKALISEQCLR